MSGDAHPSLGRGKNDHKNFASKNFASIHFRGIAIVHGKINIKILLRFRRKLHVCADFFYAENTIIYTKSCVLTTFETSCVLKFAGYIPQNFVDDQ